MNFSLPTLFLTLAAIPLLLAACVGSDEANSGTTSNRLATVKERGHLNCTSHVSFPGFGYQDSSGNYRGFDIDLCRAVAAAVFGDPNAIGGKAPDLRPAGRGHPIRRKRRRLHDHHLDQRSGGRLGQLRRHHVLQRPSIHGGPGTAATTAPWTWTAPRCASPAAPPPS